jgi:AcrR family transcriptional regulator
LEAATRMFGDEGTGNVSIRRIAAASGVSLATVHHYFGTKEQLYEACIASMYTELEDLRGDLSRAFEQTTSQWSMVEECVRIAFRFAWDHRGALRLLMRTIIDAGSMDPVHRQEVHLPFLDQVSQVLGRAFSRRRSEMRLAIQSVMHLVVRYALTDIGELALIAGTNDQAKALVLIEDHLAHCALALIMRK